MINRIKISRETQIELCCTLFILLFVYAAVSKFFDFHNFQVELSKSPILTDMAIIVSWGVPFAELVTAALLLRSSTRLTGLYISLGLMSVFTFYIISILTFSEHIPCTCGGVLQKLGWREHLIFNFAFMVLGAYAIRAIAWSKQVLGRVILVVVFSGLTVAGLFAGTYNETEKYSSFEKTSFIATATREKSVDLGFNSYYFAGISNDHIFLGNQTAPNILLRVDPRTLKLEQLVIQTDSRFTTYARMHVVDNSFFIADGAQPLILEGSLADLKAEKSAKSYRYFSDFIPVSKSRAVVRMLDSLQHYVLAILTDNSPMMVKMNILKPQVDGRFCVDGKFNYNQESRQLLYTYAYRNNFLTFDTMLTKAFVRRTLDTVSVAKIKVRKIKDNESSTSVVVPEVIVNKQSFLYSDFVFIRSNIRARNEEAVEFQIHPRIDVFYAFTGQYIASFNLPLNAREKPQQLFGMNERIFALIDQRMVTFSIEKILDECRAVAIKRNFYRPVK